MSDLSNECEYLGSKRHEFQKELIGAVYGVKQYINVIREDLKAAKLRPGQAAQLRAQMAHKKKEI
jgi:hypothetical protein